MDKLIKFFKDNLVAILLALIPFAPNAYEKLFTEKSVHFLYERHYQKNPIEEWNRTIEQLSKSLDPEELQVKNPPPPLLRAIGKEIRKSIPAMMAGMGVKPFDYLEIQIYNKSDND